MNRTKKLEKAFLDYEDKFQLLQKTLTDYLEYFKEESNKEKNYKDIKYNKGSMVKLKARNSINSLNSIKLDSLLNTDNNNTNSIHSNRSKNSDDDANDNDDSLMNYEFINSILTVLNELSNITIDASKLY